MSIFTLKRLRLFILLTMSAQICHTANILFIFAFIFASLLSLGVSSMAHAIAPLCQTVLIPRDFLGVNKAMHDVRFNDNGVEKSFMRTDRDFNMLISVDFRYLGNTDYVPEKYRDPHSWKGMNVIDTGCGGGSFVEDLRSIGVNAVGVDMMLEERQKDKDYFRQADLRHTGYPANSFDVLFNSYNIFHYVETPEFYREAIREFIRVLKPGGVIFVVGANRGIRHFLEFKDQLRVLRQSGDVYSLSDSSDVIVQKISN